MHEPKKGRAVVSAFMTDLRAAFPDLNFWDVGGLLGEGDYVVSRWEGGGTHISPAFSDFRMGSIAAASGRKTHFTGIPVLRLQDGHIAEELGQEDALPAMQQLGLLRPPEPHVGAHSGRAPLPIGWNRMKG
jgi:predicted ester cyclase